MKIKTWLLLSYFIVMILPLLCAYFLFAWVTSYHNDQKIEEYYDAYSEIQSIKNVVSDKTFYDPKLSKDKLDQLAGHDVTVNLYSADGMQLYTSVADSNPNKSMTKQNLYKNLYDMQEGLRSFDYREPVFADGELIGFFEIEIARDELIASIIRRGWIVIGLFIASFILIYVGISVVVNRKLNKRLYGLMDEMSAFASGTPRQETETGKDEMGELKEQFYGMRKQITAAQEAITMEQKEKEYMVASISHDLKTPLTSIKAYAESLHMEDVSTQDQQAYQQVIIEKADFIKQMLDDLMIHSLLQSKDYVLDLVQVDGEEFFDMLISDYDALCASKGVQLNAWNNVTGAYAVHPKQLMRVADNLMMNAIQHTPKSKKVWIVALSKTDDVGDWLHNHVREQYVFDFDHFAYLLVQNEGKGIPEEKLEYIFDPLYQVDQARSKKNTFGTGLGLAITKQIINKHNGTVAAMAKDNVGACFICSIPKENYA